MPQETNGPVLCRDEDREEQSAAGLKRRNDWDGAWKRPYLKKIGGKPDWHQWDRSTHFASIQETGPIYLSSAGRTRTCPQTPEQVAGRRNSSAASIFNPERHRLRP